MAVWISKLMNVLCRPLVKRVCAELKPSFEEQAALLRRGSPPVLPLVVKNEIEFMQELPIGLFDEHDSWVVVGFCSKELQGVINNAVCIEPPVVEESSLASMAALFLDEYHFVHLIHQLPTLFVPVRKAIVLPFRGRYLEESLLRQTLHQLGFPEIFMLDCDRLSGVRRISGVSHPAPVSADPIMISPVAEPVIGTRWLVASRYPGQQ